jgi:hypothetical protein
MRGELLLCHDQPFFCSVIFVSVGWRGGAVAASV